MPQLFSKNEHIFCAQKRKKRPKPLVFKVWVRMGFSRVFSFPRNQKTALKRRFYLMVEMIRLELTTYTLRTYRSTG